MAAAPVQDCFVSDIEIQNLTRHIEPSFIMSLGIMLSFTSAEVVNEIIRLSHDILHAIANLVTKWRNRQLPGSDVRAALAEALQRAELNSLGDRLKKGKIVKLKNVGRFL